jgi:hypothetical protein
VRSRGAAVSCFVAAVRAKCSHSSRSRPKSHSSMQHRLFGLPRWILCEKSCSFQRKLWACSWLCYSPASPFSVSVSPDSLIGRIVALSDGHNRKSSSRHHWQPSTQGPRFEHGPLFLCMTHREIARPNTRLQITRRPRSREKLCTLAPQVC